MVTSTPTLASSPRNMHPIHKRQGKRRCSQFFGVRDNNSKSNPFRAVVLNQHLGSFPTEEKAAKCVDQKLDELGADLAFRNFPNGMRNTDENLAAMKKPGVGRIPGLPMTKRKAVFVPTEDGSGVMRKKARKASCFFGVGRNSNSKSKPWRARVMKVHLGNFRTQEEAAQRVDQQLNELGADARYRNFINGKPADKVTLEMMNRKGNGYSIFKLALQNSSSLPAKRSRKELQADESETVEGRLKRARIDAKQSNLSQQIQDQRNAFFSYSAQLKQSASQFTAPDIKTRLRMASMRSQSMPQTNGHLPISPTDPTPDIKPVHTTPSKPRTQPSTPTTCRQPLQPMRVLASPANAFVPSMQRVMGRVIKPEVRKHNVDSSFGPLQRLSSSQNSPPPDGRSKFGLYGLQGSFRKFEPAPSNGQSTLCKLSPSGFKPPGQPSERPNPDKFKEAYLRSSSNLQKNAQDLQMELGQCIKTCHPDPQPSSKPGSPLLPEQAAPPTQTPPKQPSPQPARPVARRALKTEPAAYPLAAAVPPQLAGGPAYRLLQLVPAARLAHVGPAAAAGRLPPPAIVTAPAPAVVAPAPQIHMGDLVAGQAPTKPGPQPKIEGLDQSQMAHLLTRPSDFQQVLINMAFMYKQLEAEHVTKLLRENQELRQQTLDFKYQIQKLKQELKH